MHGKVLLYNSVKGWFTISHIVCPHQILKSFPISEHSCHLGHHFLHLVAKVCKVLLLRFDRRIKILLLRVERRRNVILFRVERKRKVIPFRVERKRISISTSDSAILAATALSFLFSILPLNLHRSCLDTMHDKVCSLSCFAAISYGITSTLPSRLGPPSITRAPCVSVLDRWLVRHLNDW
jgi:hypothetical protein